MPRPLTGSIRRRSGLWCASVPDEPGTTRRREERFTTEIVLQPYNGKLIMLDGTNGREGTNGRPLTAPNGDDPDDQIPF